MRHKVATELRYPNLWHGCVGAWSPCLGPSGTTLRDNSGFGRHGTLENMEPTDWAIVDGVPCLGFGGTDERVNFGTITSPFTQQSLSVWARTATSATMGILSTGVGGTTEQYLALVWLSGGVIRFDVDNGTLRKGINLGTGLNTSVWHHLAGVYSGTTMSCYLNGKFVTSTDQTGDIQATNVWTIGDYGPAANWLTGQVTSPMVYNRVLAETEIKLLATRPGIAYETRRTVRSYSAGAAPPATGRRHLMLLGVGR